MHRRPDYAFERVIGASHVRSGKPCQDEAGATAVADVVAVAIADGHGTSKHAEVGARLAVQVALEALVRFSEGLNDPSAGLADARLAEAQRYAEHPLRAQLVREWAARVRTKANDPAASLLDYGSTLTFALSTPHFILVGQIGDGDVLLVAEDGSVTAPLPRDPAAFADETPSLCQSDAWHSLRVRVLPPPTREVLLMLSTDGYSNSYASDDQFRRIGPDYLELVRDEGLAGLQPHLRGFLEQITAQGAGDDIAIALVYWPAATGTTDGAQPQPADASEHPADGALESAAPSNQAADSQLVSTLLDSAPRSAAVATLEAHPQVDSVPSPDAATAASTESHAPPDVDEEVVDARVPEDL